MTNNVEQLEKEESIKKIILLIKDWFSYFRSKWITILVCGVLGCFLGGFYAFTKKPVYVSTLTFALEEEKSGSGGLAGALGFASSLGLDLGSGAGGAFSGSNITQLLKSRLVVEKALLNKCDFDTTQSLADYYIRALQINQGWEKDKLLKEINFSRGAERSTRFTIQQDSVLFVLYRSLAVGPNSALSVLQKDKKVSIITIEVKSIDEQFSKAFAESIVKEVTAFYVDTKSKKARQNVAILQFQADSIRRELNSAITGVAIASDNTYNLNPALLVRKSTGLQRQVDVQANTAILTQLVTNLEMAKVALRKETPLIQIIDKPILPLEVIKLGKIRTAAIGGFVLGAIGITLLGFLRWWKSFSSRVLQ